MTSVVVLGIMHIGAIAHKPSPVRMAIMEQLSQENGAGDGRSLSDVLTGMAKDRPVGSSDSPEADRVQSRPLKETLVSIARDGLDPLMGRGFERETHAQAADQYSEERRRGLGREQDPQGRDFA
jgi:hypothetical protein